MNAETPFRMNMKFKHFDAIAAGTKTTEYRRLGGRFVPERFPRGRLVRFVRGYTKTTHDCRTLCATIVRFDKLPDSVQQDLIDCYAASAIARQQLNDDTQILCIHLQPIPQV